MLARFLSRWLNLFQLVLNMRSKVFTLIYILFSNANLRIFISNISHS